MHKIVVIIVINNKYVKYTISSVQILSQTERSAVGTAFKSHATSFNIHDGKEDTTEETEAHEQMGTNASPATINGPTMVRKLPCLFTLFFGSVSTNKHLTGHFDHYNHHPLL